MRRSSATTRFIFKALCGLHKTVGWLSDPERGAAMRAAGTAARRVALWRTRVVRSRSEFVKVPLRFVCETNCVMISGVQG